MRLETLFSISIFLVGALVHGEGAFIHNQCGENIYILHTDTTGVSHPVVVLPPGNTYSEGIPGGDVGVSLKIGTTPALSAPVIWEYRWDTGTNIIFVDIVEKLGDPFFGVMRGSYDVEGKCGAIWCKPLVACPGTLLACPPSDIEFVVCA
jgi:hypothetical protein